MSKPFRRTAWSMLIGGVLVARLMLWNPVVLPTVHDGLGEPDPADRRLDPQAEQLAGAFAATAHEGHPAQDNEDTDGDGCPGGKAGIGGSA